MAALTNKMPARPQPYLHLAFTLLLLCFDGGSWAWLLESLACTWSNVLGAQLH